MAPNTTTTATTTVVTEPPKDESREVCHYTKRVIMGLVNLISLIITCFYISHAYQHHKVINENPSILKAPYGTLDLSWEKIGYIAATGRAVLLALTLLSIISVPEWMMFAYSMLLLVFEVPMACTAESNFGYLVNFGQLDLSPPTVVCSNTTMTARQWQFYTDYSNIAGRPTTDVCKEFVHEGALLRASLLFSWFSFWIPVFLVAFIFAICKPERKWNTFLIYFTGIELSFSWAGVKRFFKPKISLRRRRSNNSGSSDSSSTLAEEVEMRAGEKV